MLPKPADGDAPPPEDDDAAEWFALAARIGPRRMPVDRRGEDRVISRHEKGPSRRGRHKPSRLCL
jgi:hypothetical protein